MKQSLVAWMVVAAAVVTVSSAPAADLTGVWLGTTQIPDRGTDQVTLVLKKGAGGYSGIVNDSFELIAKDTSIEDVKQDGDVLTFAFPLADGVRVTIRLEFSGDRAAGGWATAEGELGTLVFERQKKK